MGFQSTMEHFGNGVRGYMLGENESEWKFVLVTCVEQLKPGKILIRQSLDGPFGPNWKARVIFHENRYRLHPEKVIIPGTETLGGDQPVYLDNGKSIKLGSILRPKKPKDEHDRYRIMWWIEDDTHFPR